MAREWRSRQANKLRSPELVDRIFALTSLKFGRDQPDGVRSPLNEGHGTMVLTNLLSSLPDTSVGEITEVLLSARGVRLERIVSHGQVSPPGYWYDQDEAEWVLVLNGSARLAIAGEREDRLLRGGDALFLPAHCRHRVTWTDPDIPTVWLALFIDAVLAPKLGEGTPAIQGTPD